MRVLLFALLTMTAVVCQDNVEILNCKELSEDSLRCLECDKDFVLSADGTSCLEVQSEESDSNEDRDSCPEDKRCLSCDGNVCVRCIYSFADANGVCQDADKVDDCKFYSSETQCELCEEGYYLSGNECKEIDVDGCALVNPESPNFCTVCEDGVVVDNGECEGEVDCSDDNCELCSSQDTCVRCDTDYALTPDGKCVKSDNNCFSVNEAGDCLRCHKRYFDNDGECKKTREQKSTFIAKVTVLFLGLMMPLI